MGFLFSRHMEIKETIQILFLECNLVGLQFPIKNIQMFHLETYRTSFDLFSNPVGLWK